MNVDTEMATTNGTKPSIVDEEPKVTTEAAAAEPEKAKRTRKTPNDAQIAEMKRLRAENVTFTEVARQTGFSVGTVQKYTDDKTKPKTEGKKRGPKPKAERPEPVAKGLDTPMAVKAAMADLLLAGHPLSGIRGALASLNLGGH